MNAIHPSTGARLGLTLTAYAEAKGLKLEFLKSLGLSDEFYLSTPAIRVPYRAPDGTATAVRFRIALDGDRFRWRKSDKPMPYGLDRLDNARKAGWVTIVEGESDCHTLWQHGLHALGLPGCGTWREDRDAASLDGIDVIYVVRESDLGGDAMIEALASSSIRPRVKVISLAPYKDPSELYLADPDDFLAAMLKATTAARPLEGIIADARADEATQDYALCRNLASSTNILDAFAASIRACGVVGEDRNAKILYLALTSRLLPKPVNVAVKGPSSGGKSWLVSGVLLHFPDAAFIFRTSFSEHALIYTNEPYQHRHLVLAEASGADGPKQEYLIRTLLSEGCIQYETVEKVGGAMTPRMIRKDGPTGLIVTTTRASLHPENETRLLSLAVSDTKEQTRAVIQAIAAESQSFHPAGPEWAALQSWLASGETRVDVPFGATLGHLVNPAATRVRRDFGTLLSLIKTHALLHRESRARDGEGRIVATLEDYAAVHDLVADLFAQGVAKTVKPIVRETAEAVRHLSVDGQVTNQAVAKRLGIDESASTRRCREAITLGYIVNEEERKGRPAKYVLGAPMPDDEAVLPSVSELEAAIVAGVGAIIPPVPPINPAIAQSGLSTSGCAVDPLSEGIAPPLPLPSPANVCTIDPLPEGIEAPLPPPPMIAIPELEVEEVI